MSPAERFPWATILSFEGKEPQIHESAFVAPGAHAAHSFDSCTGSITTLPAVISTQGNWCFNKDLSIGQSGVNAITVDANNVTIDCNGYKLGGLSAGPGTSSTAILSSRFNTTIRNCTIRGFLYAVRLQDGAGHLIEDNRFDGNLRAGVVSYADATIIRRNLIVDTGGGTAAEGDAWGILAYGTAEIIDNTVSVVDPLGPVNGNGYGIFSGNSPSSITGNRVSQTNGMGTGQGIGIASAQYAVVEGNQVMGAGGGVSHIGITCPDVNTSVVRNIVSAFEVGIDADCTVLDNVVN